MGLIALLGVAAFVAGLLGSVILMFYVLFGAASAVVDVCGRMDTSRTRAVRGGRERLLRPADSREGLLRFVNDGTRDRNLLRTAGERRGGRRE